MKQRTYTVRFAGIGLTLGIILFVLGHFLPAQLAESPPLLFTYVAVARILLYVPPFGMILNYFFNYLLNSLICHGICPPLYYALAQSLAIMINLSLLGFYIDLLKAAQHAAASLRRVVLYLLLFLGIVAGLMYPLVLLTDAAVTHSAETFTRYLVLSFVLEMLAAILILFGTLARTVFSRAFGNVSQEFAIVYDQDKALLSGIYRKHNIQMTHKRARAWSWSLLIHVDGSRTIVPLRLRDIFSLDASRLTAHLNTAVDTVETKEQTKHTKNTHY
ncbi:hypothetical protein COY95_03660 [Candidatus Woesearchaeota archaeon CG_4_10_14_0_8_um_filter_47_5]|nr:MAG: hypothetical protein COY95_03660 [Candidatus Woesearchaeota archaeon CG_4_10_14_0_8_um_filter_47_5]